MINIRIKTDTIDSNLGKCLKNNNGHAPKSNGLSKIHEIRTPLRQVTYFVGVTLYNLCRYLINRMRTKI